MSEQSELYHYSLDLEYTLLELFGKNSKWDGCAGAFQDVAIVRQAILAATFKIRSRIVDIVTADDRLLLITSLALDGIEREAQELRGDGGSLLEITAHLLALVAYLLGYDWQMGKPNRMVIYCQTSDQQWIDDTNYHPEAKNPSHSRAEFDKRLELVCMLNAQKLRIPQIARIMNLSETNVKNLLVWASKVERMSQTKAYNG
jgi:hypothetical protein